QRVDERRRIRFREHARVLAGELALLVEIFTGRDAIVAKAPERGGEFAAVTRELRFDVPVRRRAELQTLLFTVDNQPHGDALHAAGAQPGLHFLPEHGRNRVAIQAIEDAATLLRANEILIDVRRVLHRLLDRFFGDLVEDDPLYRHLRLQNFLEVPADRLALAIRVGGEVHLRRALQRRTQRLDILFLVVRDDVVRREVAFGVDAEPSPFLLADLIGA